MNTGECMKKYRTNYSHERTDNELNKKGSIINTQRNLVINR